MNLDDRSNKILEELISNPSITSKDMEKKYDLTRRQLGYSFDKINDWLISKNLPAIERTRQGHFIIDQSLFTKLNMDHTVESADMDILSEKQRVYMIVMMLLSNDELSLNHFTSELDVSKNTVLSDLKRAQDYVGEYDLTIRYSRKLGYVIEGKEFLIRKLLIHVTYKFLEMNNGASRLRNLAAIHENEIIELNKRIAKVENKLNLKFTDEKIDTMPYTLTLVLRRIKKGQKVSSFYIKYEELSDTKEYLATEEILYDIEDIPMEERLFITLHLLTTNVHWSGYLTEQTIPNLMQALDDMLRLFEKRACIFLQDKEQLLNKLLLHVNPAYYRIKYQLTEINHVQDSVSKEFMALHHLVQKSTKPLEELIGMKIPESETTYLTMLIGGWLTRQGDSIQEKVKAIVVCPKGVSVSRLMFSELRELFPEFVFLDSLSVREFQGYTLDYDIVFSPTFLETDKKLFMANSFLEREEKHRLRKQVMMELHGYIPFDINVEDLISIVKNHASVNDEQELSKELLRYINRDDTAAVKTKQVRNPIINLSDLITPETITLKQSVPSWEAAIQTASKPLIENGYIEQEYVNAMVNHYDKDPYIVIGPNIAIPHAAPDEGVNEVSMSLLVLAEGVNYTEDYSINLVIVIAAVDKKQHLKALMQLMKLAGSEEDRNAVIQAGSVDEIWNIIKSYSKE
ncbi:BglG family transcription antiterminator [Aquibacillus sp. 3ASR75-11]|uniref:Ascorbate-specific PTS system EIIA component n=1 Tax=Terrihalobacillus insolitus TaxID=2950438 RepID=A0A9X3WT62_9BACI|nr:BglG family transcription antiterminator [Terrihalobacillus insolitus]MDC3411922.1 BglG family transcription antiterminator [Terrihalobacillus insolitus]MDC3423391.1 BglG family transcription antiterminator [Terrihalobacillus insolitus]